MRAEAPPASGERASRVDDEPRRRALCPSVRALHWFRKDLRLSDNAALAAAASESAGGVAVAYVSEPSILRRPDLAPCRVAFVLGCLRSLDREVERAGGRLILRHGEAAEEVPRLAEECGADAVFWNAEYEPALVERDRRVAAALERRGIRARILHDRLLVPPGEVLTREGKPYTVFTPFQRACEERSIEVPYPRVERFLRLERVRSKRVAKAEKLGFHPPFEVPEGGESDAEQRLVAFCEHQLWNYAEGRDRIDAECTTRLSADLRFGTISPRRVAALAKETARGARGARRDALLRSTAKLVSELRWRDFYTHILWHFPHVETGAFRRECDRIRWNESEEGFEAWREGRTGYPIVDAALRCLRSTGWMHNRARMIVASFLTKDLGLDWRRGERHFMNGLLDGDLASNNGGWQWAASTGTDAAPYFRVFNPVLQGRRFDPEGRFVARWCPELARLPAGAMHAPWEASPLEREAAGVRLGRDYPRPCVDHSKARAEAIARFEALPQRPR